MIFFAKRVKLSDEVILTSSLQHTDGGKVKMDEFEKKFKFDPDYVGYMGAEEELWTVDSAGRLIPAAIRLFEMIGEDGDIKPELPAQQVEAVTGKCATVQELYDNIEQNRIRLDDLGREFGFEILSESIPPGRFELIPYPKKRYKQIMQQYSKSVLRHAWIAGLHLHIGCSSKEAAIYFVNCFRNDLPALLGFSAGPISPEGYASERFFSYSEMCPDLVPPYLESFEHYTELAKEREFYDDPRRCWWLIRINPHGTVELRVFDAQPDAIIAQLSWLLW